MLNGVLVVNKPTGITSREVVNKVSKRLGTKKVGHTGTLDPLASGVLVMTIGKYTKLCNVLTSSYKEYVATMEFGILTDTLDSTGQVLKEEKRELTDEEMKKAVLLYNQKKYLQEVPIYSAIKVRGRKLYEYARNHESIELPKKEVEVQSVEIIAQEKKTITFRTLVSKGTYIRSLIRDMASSIDTIAIMTNLIRTKQGKFKIEDAYTLEEIEKGNYTLLTIEDILDVTTINDYSKIKDIINGVKITYPSTKEYLLFKDGKKEIALYKKEGKFYCMAIKLC